MNFTINLLSFIDFTINLLKSRQTEEEIVSYLKRIDESFNQEEMDFELFCRLVAILLEESNNLQQRNKEEDELMDNPEENQQNPFEISLNESR